MRFLFISSSCPPLGSMCQDTDRLWRTVGPLILWFAEGPAPADSNRGGKSRGIYITLGSPIKGLLCMKGHTSGASLAPAPLLLEALIPGSLGASPDQPAWRGYTHPSLFLHPADPRHTAPLPIFSQVIHFDVVTYLSLVPDAVIGTGNGLKTGFWDGVNHVCSIGK